MKYTLSLFLLIFLSACENTSGIGLRPTDALYENNLIIKNKQLGKKLIITDVKTKSTSDLMDVVVTLSSQYKKTQYVQYQFDWYDEHGFVIGGNHSPWQAISIFGYANVHLPALAPVSHATRFSLEVREVSVDTQKFKKQR